MASANNSKGGLPPASPTMAQRIRNFGSFVTSCRRNTPVPPPSTADLATPTNASEQTEQTERVADITTMTTQPQPRRIYNTNIYGPDTMYNDPDIMYRSTIVPILSPQRENSPPIPPRRASSQNVQVRQQHHPITQHQDMIPSLLQTYAMVDPYLRRPTQRMTRSLD